MNDITIIFITANKVPKSWAEYQKQSLIEAACGSRIITISYEPLDWGNDNLIQTEYNLDNVYRQMLRGAKMATTSHIAVAEDDTLYSMHHFHSIKFSEDAVFYNLCCWQLQTWNPVYYLRVNFSNHAMVAPTKLFVDAIEERYAKFPDGLPHAGAGEVGRVSVEAILGVTNIKARNFSSNIGIVHFQHPYSIDPLEQKQKKRVGPIRAYDIPYWGPSSELVKKFT
jgi:hypothetical protein